MDTSQHNMALLKLKKAQHEVETLGTSMRSFSDVVARQQTALARLAASIPPNDNMQGVIAGTSAIAAIVDEINRVLPQLDSSISDLERHLTSQLKEHENLTALYNVSKIVNSTLDLAEVLDLVMDMIISVTGAERGFLMLFDKETGEMDFKVARNMDRETIAGSSFEISRSIVYRAAEEGEPILTTNAQADERFRNQQSVVIHSLRSILCVPLRVKGQIIGVIYADNRIKTGLFTDADKQLLTAFADQAAIAIDNARLFDSVKRNLEEITNMKNLMDNIFASIASGVITTDIRDRITQFNRSAENILGRPAKECIGRPYIEVLSSLEGTPFSRMVEDTKRMRRQYRGYEFDVEIPQKGLTNLSMNISTLRDSQDSTLGVAIVVDDVTEKKKFERERAMVKRYLPPELVDNLPTDLSDLKLTGERQEMTTFFADVRGFSTFSEHVDPAEVMQTINAYFSIAARCIMSHGGIVDKYLGDAVMAHFNPPIRPQDDHAWLAVRAAWDFKQDIEKYHAGVPEAKRLYLGIGINTGESVVGNVGAEDRMEYTAIGDSINLAKRLQENAGAGQIILSRSTYELVKDRVLAEELQPIKVKGRSAMEQVYELTGLK